MKILQLDKFEITVVFRGNDSGQSARAFMESSISGRLARIQFVRRCPAVAVGKQALQPGIACGCVFRRFLYLHGDRRDRVLG